MKQNDFSIFGRGSPKEHFCEIILTKAIAWEEMLFEEIVDRQTEGWMDDRQISITIAHLELR